MANTGFTTYAEKKILDYVFSQAAFAAIGTLYVGLFTAAPTDAGGGTEVTIGSNNYARAVVTNNATNFPAATGGSPSSKSNGAAITFNTASGSWGTIVAFGIFDASTAGNLIFWGALTTSKAVALNDTPSFAIGDLVMTLD